MANPLTPGQRALLADALHARRRAVLRQLEEHHGGLSRAEHASDVLRQDADDEAQRASDRAVDLAISDLDTQALQDIERALVRMGDSGFGLCRDCKRAIGFDRLLAELDAERCIGCQTQAENRNA